MRDFILDIILPVVAELVGTCFFITVFYLGAAFLRGAL